MRRYHIYIVLTRTNTIISKLIHILTNAEYTHAAISLDSELEHMYSFGRRWTYNPFIGKFKHEDIDEGAYKFSSVLPGLIMEIEVSKEQYIKANGLLDEFIMNSNYYKYNYMGLFHNLLNMGVCYDNRFLCSEFVYHILKESGIADFKESRNLIKPQDLLNLDGNIIYKGDLKAIKYNKINNEGSLLPVGLSDKIAF